MSAVDFAFVEPPSATITVRGVEIVVTPLVVCELSPFARAIAPVSDGLGVLMGLFRQATDAGADPDDLVVAQAVLALIGSHGGDVLRALSIAVRQPWPWIEQLRLDEAVALAVVAIRINADFFARTLPAMASSVEQLRSVMSTVMPTSGVMPLSS